MNQKEEILKFKCPTCGNIDQDEVIFLCNVCKQDEMVFKNGAYICPSCFEPGTNFECYRCSSKEVKLVK